MTEQRRTVPKRSNIPMILMIVAIVMFGLIILFSVSGPAGYAKEERSSLFYVRTQIVYTIIGFAACIGVSFIDISFFKNKIIWIGAYVASLVSMIGIATVGYSLNGAKRWFKIGSRTIQPSEFVKFLLVIFVAGYRAWRIDCKKAGKTCKSDKWYVRMLYEFFWEFLLPVTLCAIVDLFILRQPHISCAVIIALVIFLSMLVSEVRLRNWVIGFLLMAVVGGAVIQIVPIVDPDFMDNYAHAFQRFRIFSAVQGDEEADVSEDEMRQVTNAHNALGSGGMWGRGMGYSRAKYNYVSEAQNDYIFSIYVEETGFVGGVLLILMYMVMFAMCFMVILRADSPFSRIMALGCTSIPMVQFLLNIAVELQIIPSTGVTLPYISYGGTAQMGLLITYGLVLCVSRSGTRPLKLKEAGN